MASIERFNLINDTWAATLAGICPVPEYLDLTARFTAETDRHVWSPILASLAYLGRILPPDLRPHLGRFVCARLGDVMSRLGWSPQREDNDVVRELRGEILRAVGTLGGDAEVQRAAQERYAAGGGSGILDPDVFAAVLAIVAHVGGETEYAEFLDRFRAAKTPQDEQRYLRALAGFRPPDLVRRTLDLSLNGSVRTQDAPFLVRDLLMGVHSRDLAWAFVREHWEEMERLYPSQSGLRRLCEGITGLVTPEFEREVRTFFETRRVTFGGKTLEQYLERLHVAVLFREREFLTLREYLARF
jgi:aminopeptidase N